jgi:hypothetical protein
LSEEVKKDNLMETPSTELLLASATTSIALWSEDKKQDFIKTFEQRNSVAQHILYYTANEIRQQALSKKFISQKHERSAKVFMPIDVHDRARTIGGRTLDELHTIAHERAESVLKNLPPLKNAVKVIDPETAKLIDDYEELRDNLQKLKDSLDEMPQVIQMSELDQNMTIGQFRKYVKKVEETKVELLEKLSKGGTELQELDITINKKLYAGIPGLSDAIIKTVNDHYERIMMLQQLSRRMIEQVKFGDSAQALEILKHFESDEMTISDNINTEFVAALAVLGVAKKTKKLKK